MTIYYDYSPPLINIQIHKYKEQDKKKSAKHFSLEDHMATIYFYPQNNYF